MEKQKIVYVLNRDTANNLTISSPLEAHRGHTVVFACIGLDMGFENPIFACIEASYQDSDGASAKANEKVKLWPWLCRVTAYLQVLSVADILRTGFGSEPCVEEVDHPTTSDISSSDSR